MKENIKKISLFFFLLSIFSCNSAQLKKNVDTKFYNILDRTINDGKKIKYIGITFIRKCDKEIIFSVDRMLFNNELPVYQSYQYKGYPVFYFTDATNETSDYGKEILNRLLKPSNYRIDSFEIKNQSVVYGEYAYFKNGKFIDDKEQISKFFENCKSSEP
ncbi:hypothetical protein P2W68_06450 [Chryseobacterium arthrosphaerae]|uniref:hypothetical protein n=1 Tax=Chryseobacterium arthrosphaerae TaxID=651561 RepID=UPI0023E2F457|nr:hypothetical protein [Chryseobacterium arthrosphaerae]WES99252.1 hypothetical protein P2W68_06450 [Chryseobacterium arthrosphaerae]